MSDSFKYTTGLQNVGSYQVAGTPYVTASSVSDGQELELQFPRVTNNIKVRLDGSDTTGTFANGSLTVAYPTASATPTYNASGTLESNHHGDTVVFGGTTFTVNYEGTGSFGANEIKTYEQTGSALEFKMSPTEPQPNAQLIGLNLTGYNSVLPPSITGGYSVSIWFKQDFNNDSNGGTLFQYGSANTALNEYSAWIFANNNQGVSVFTRTDSTNAQATGTSNHYQLGQWTHTVVTFQSGSGEVTNGIKICVNGVFVKQGNSRAHMASNSSVIRVGDGTPQPIAAIRHLSGSIQNVCIWQGLLNGDDANKLYNSGSIKDPTDVGGYNATLVDWWRLDSGSTGFNQVGSTAPQETYISNNGRNLTPQNTTDFRTFNSCSQGVPFERHTRAEFYNAVTAALDTHSNFGTFSVATPTAASSVISIQSAATGTAGNGALPSNPNNETFTAVTDTAGGTEFSAGAGGGNLRIHFRSKDHSNVISNGHFWTLANQGDSVELNVKTKEAFLSATGGDCSFTFTSDLTNIPKFRMYQHTGSGVDE